MTMTTPTDPTAPTATPEKPQDELDKDAWDATAELRRLLIVRTLPKFTYNSFFAAGNAIHAALACRKYRPILLLFPDYHIRHLDNLELIGRATRFVQTEINARVAAIKQVPELAKEGYDLRSLMMELAAILVRKERIEAEVVERLREGSGYRDLVEDLNVLVRLMRGQPRSIVGEETTVTLAEVSRAAEIAHEINLRIGHERRVGLSQQELLDERTKLGALLTEAHGQVHRAMAFLRYGQGDLDDFVPSLYVPAGPRKAGGDGAVDETVQEAVPAAAPAEPGPPLDPEDNPFVTEE